MLLFFSVIFFFLDLKNTFYGMLAVNRWYVKSWIYKCLLQLIIYHSNRTPFIQKTKICRKYNMNYKRIKKYHRSRYTLRSTLYTLHSTLYTLHSTLYTLHSTLYTLHSTLYTLLQAVPRWLDIALYKAMQRIVKVVVNI